MTSRCKYHCSACGCHFTSLRAFDAHRQGPFLDGVCGLAVIGSARQVTVYEHESAEAARTHFSGASEGDS